MTLQTLLHPGDVAPPLCSGPCGRCPSWALNCPSRRHGHAAYSCSPTLASLRLLLVTEPSGVLPPHQAALFLCRIPSVLQHVLDLLLHRGDSPGWAGSGTEGSAGAVLPTHRTKRKLFCASIPYEEFGVGGGQKELAMLLWKYKRHPPVGRYQRRVLAPTAPEVLSVPQTFRWPFLLWKNPIFGHKIIWVYWFG